MVTRIKIASFVPSYPENEDECARAVRYLELAERYASEREPDWTFVHTVIQGRRVGDGHVWSAERDREIGRVRDLGWIWARDTDADWGVSLDSDLMVGADLFSKLVYLGRDYHAKTAHVWNVETGRYRFVGADFHAVWTLSGTDRKVHYASELVAMDKV